VIDVESLKVLIPELDEEKVKKGLLKPYGQIENAL